MKNSILYLSLLLYFACSASAAEKQNGVNYHPTWRGAMEVSHNNPYDQESYLNMRSMGINWLALNITAYQRTLSDTTISLDAQGVGKDGVRFFLTPSDEEVAFAIKRARGDGIKVMLKPYVTTLGSLTEQEEWHGMIGTSFSTKKQWDDWFVSYTEFILHYARLARDFGADQLCIGTELRGTIGRESQWRELISTVRRVYKGLITYGSHHSAVDQIQWWDALDAIGVDAYFSLTDRNDPSLEELKAGWRPHMEKLARLSKKWGKPILFTELGYSSFDGVNREPWALRPERETDLQEQADLYQAFFEEVYPQPWLAGVYWWVWYPQLTVNYQEKNYQPYGKPAEKILQKWYGAPGVRRGLK